MRTSSRPVLSSRSKLRAAVRKVEMEQNLVRQMERRTASSSMAAIRETAARTVTQAASATAGAADAAKASLRFGAIDLNEEKNADLVIARHLWQDHRLLPPLSTGRDRWGRLLNLFMFYTCFILPMRVAFGEVHGLGLIVFEIIVDFCFMIDVSHMQPSLTMGAHDRCLEDGACLPHSIEHLHKKAARWSGGNFSGNGRARLEPACFTCGLCSGCRRCGQLCICAISKGER